MLSVSSPIRKAGGWGGAVGFWPDTKSGRGGGGGGGSIQNVLKEGAEKLARAKFLATTPILETEGGARAP